MTPVGQRGFATAEQAKNAAKGRDGVTSFVVLHDPRRQEFAWVAPVEFFMTRSFACINAGIQVVEMG